MNTSELVESLGGTSAVAALCDITPSAVSQWRDGDYVPKVHHKFFALYCPDLWGKYAKTEKAAA